MNESKMEKKDKQEFGDCGNNHKWAPLPVYSSSRSIGRVSLMRCNNCLTVKVIQQRVGYTIQEPIETLVELKNSAYPYMKDGKIEL